MKGGDELKTRLEVLARLDAYAAYCEENLPTSAWQVQWEQELLPLYNAVNDYFDASAPELGGAINTLIQSMYCDILRRTCHYENDAQFDLGLNDDYPVGYDDVGDCFYTFSWLSTSPEEFANSFSFDLATGAVSSDLMDGWVTDLSTARADDITAVQTLSSWCSNSGSCCDLVNLLEDRGALLEQKSTLDIAKIIYIDRGVLTVIQEFNLSSYIPTYYQE